uniref:Rep protein n=1 Tax=Clostridium beijerinckii TaxID=1520 RepID=Q9X6D4_CLOBE|nr:Rep protein [Clostridium beijerinckii]
MDKNIILLSDKDKKDKERPWVSKKVKSDLLADSYERLKMFKKSEKVRDCGSFLEFRRFHDQSLKLNYANFCKDRLCPMCGWRRSLKIFGQTSQIMDKVTADKNYKFIFLTLTIRNVKGDDLSDTIDHMFKTWHLFIKRKKIKDSVLGWFRALEVTHDVDQLITPLSYSIRKKTLKKLGLNVGDPNPTFNTYHPHFHCIMMVPSRYYKEKELYIKQSDFSTMWKEVLKIDYEPIVHVEKFKGDTDYEVKKGVAESTKYTVKDNDYLLEDDELMTDSTVNILSNALFRRRLVALGGEFKKIAKELKLDDCLDGDLVHTDQLDRYDPYDKDHVIDALTGGNNFKR